MSNNFSEIFKIHAFNGRLLLASSSVVIRYRKLSNQDARKLERKWNLIIWDYEKKRETVIQYFDVNDNYYIVATDVTGNICLFNSYDKSSYFVTVVCDLEPNNANKCPILIHPTLSGVIFANFKPVSKNSHTYISKNSGKTFEKIQHEDKKSDLKLNIPCKYSQKKYFPKEWIIMTTGSVTNIRNNIYTNFVSFDGGQIWKIIRFSNLGEAAINGGGTIVVVNGETNKIAYSFDEGKTYYQMPVFKNDDVLLNAFIVGTTINERIVVYGRNSNKSRLMIAYFDFRSLLKHSCQIDDYSPWSVIRSNKNCYRGQERVYLKKNINSMCFDNQTYTLNITKPCPCDLEDFQW
ncbi:VPS10 domain-containing receptor SorCS1 [Thelohanellus kitauei]|uniref:VPS10 domain-containing receptor SorCS1 n=1 Tax=Thelohanellus kitauei TaxID=669202 RepID=A0A0C2MKV9_THEKT|nr:VPS10 domain-containing receptor SorCS1 [Thelohanellus kitauei]